MKSNKIEGSVHVRPVKVTGISHNNASHVRVEQNVGDTVSFTGLGNVAKRGWLGFRKLSAYMKDSSEMTNAFIAAIGTAIIAPIAIMSSPSKEKNLSPEEQKEKKKFQALRQPVSALLALGFQVPTTIGIKKLFNKWAYVDHKKLFDDEVLGTLVPDKEYLAKKSKNEVKQALAEGKTEIHGVNVEEAMNELKDKIRKEYSDVDLSISDEKVNKLAEKRKVKFISEEVAGKKQDKFLDGKVDELISSGKKFDINELDLVTEDDMKLAKQRYKEQFKQLKKDAKLNIFDEFIELMGFSTKKVKAFNEREKALAKELGLEILKKENPMMFTDSAETMKHFIKHINSEAQATFKNKIYWISLLTNFVMVALSCVALNWFHPRFAALVEEISDKHKANKDVNDKKVEVAA